MKSVKKTKGIGKLLGFIILLVGIAAGIILVSQPQLFNQKAANVDYPTACSRTDPDQSRSCTITNPNGFVRNGIQYRTCNQNTHLWGNWTQCSETLVSYSCSNACDQSRVGCSGDNIKYCNKGEFIRGCVQSCAYNPAQPYAGFGIETDPDRSVHCIGFKCVLPPGCNNRSRGYVDPSAVRVDWSNCAALGY